MKISLRGEEWKFVDVKWASSHYVESFDLENGSGQLFDWDKDLTDEERTLIDEGLEQLVRDDHDD
jgi:hypothetical protein